MSGPWLLTVHVETRYLTVSVDGKALKYRAIEVAIFNSGIMAKTLYPKGPDIRIDDGHLDVWIMGIQTILDYPRYLFEMITGKPAKRLSHFINARRLSQFKSRLPLPVQADGDIIVPRRRCRGTFRRSHSACWRETGNRLNTTHGRSPVLFRDIPAGSFSGGSGVGIFRLHRALCR